MLDASDERIWDEIRRGWEAEADELDRPRGTRPAEGREHLPVAVIGGGWGAVLLVLFGVPWAGLAVGAAVTLLWLLWRFLPQLERAGIADTGTAAADLADHRQARRHGDGR